MPLIKYEGSNIVRAFYSSKKKKKMCAEEVNYPAFI